MPIEIHQFEINLFTNVVFYKTCKNISDLITSHNCTFPKFHVNQYKLHVGLEVRNYIYVQVTLQMSSFYLFKDLIMFHKITMMKIDNLINSRVKISNSVKSHWKNVSSLT